MAAFTGETLARWALVLLVLGLFEADAIRVEEQSDSAQGQSADDDDGAEDSRDEIQECVDAVKKNEVKMVYTSTDGPFAANVSMSAAGCFFNLAREAFFARDEDEEEAEVQVNLASGNNDWSRVTQETLTFMLAFGHGKLVSADFDMQKVEFSEIERPVQNDLKAAKALDADAEFIDQVASEQKLFSLATAAHYVDFPELYQLCTAKIATMIWGKTKEEIQTVLSQQS